MKVRKFVRQTDVHVRPATNLREAANLMRRSGLSCLPVIADGVVIAILTERDFVKAMAASDRPCDARAADYMSDGAVTVALDDETAVAMAKMFAIGCRDLPVVDDRKLLGMISARDVLAARVQLSGVSV